ncbi:phage tail protein [Cerasibacillus sp. JNUCC 74]
MGDKSNAAGGFMEAFVSQADGLKSAGDSFAVLQEQIDPVVNKLAEMEQSLGFIPGMSEGIAQVQAVLEPFLGMIGGMSTLLLTISSVMTNFLPKMMVLKEAVMGLFAILAANPLALIITLVTLLATAFVYLWTNSQTFRDIMMSVWEAILAFIMPIIQEIVGFVMSVWGQLTAWWTQNQALILQTFQTIWGAILAVITTVMNFLMPFLTAAWQTISTVITTVWNTIKTVIQLAMTIVMGIIRTVMQVITGNWSGAWETIKSTFQNVWSIMKEFVTTMATRIWETIQTKFTQVKETISTLIGNAKDAVVQGFLTMVSNAVEKAQSIVSTVRQKFQEVFNAIRTKLTEAVTEVGTQIAKMPGKVIEFSGRMISAGKDLIMGLITGIKDNAKKVGEAVLKAAKDAVDGVLSFLGIKSPSRLFRDIGDDTMAGFALGINQMAKSVIAAASTVSDKVQDSFDPQFALPAISGQVHQLNQAANHKLSNQVLNEWHVQKQPAMVNVSIGKQQFSAFVEDITNAQSRKTNLTRQQGW